MFKETLVKCKEGAFHLGPERPRVYFDLSPEEKDRYNADSQATNILIQGSLKDIYTLINHYTDAKDIWDNVKMLLEAVKLNRGFRDFNYDLMYVYLMQHKGLALNVYNVFQADDCDAFDSNVDEAPTAQTMLMANQSSAYPVYGETGSSYDSDILSELKSKERRKRECKQPKPKPVIEKSSKPAPAPKSKATKERPSKASTTKLPKLKPAKEKSTKTTPPQKAGKGKITKVRKVKYPF
nr:hypothetical protein [Tanacetum cinerariifolium]